MESNQNGSSAAQLTCHLPREVRQRSIKDSRPYFQQVKTRKNSPVDYSNDQTDRLERTTKERNEEVDEITSPSITSLFDDHMRREQPSLAGYILLIIIYAKKIKKNKKMNHWRVRENSKNLNSRKNFF